VVRRSEPESGPALVENDASELFSRGIALEENPSTQAEAIAAYRKVLELEPNHPAAHINLGTLHYNRQDYGQAERHYRSAIEIDPRYALAYFDLGNVLDETGRVQEAIQTYKTALQLAPTYAVSPEGLVLSTAPAGLAPEDGTVGGGAAISVNTSETRCRARGGAGPVSATGTAEPRCSRARFADDPCLSIARRASPWLPLLGKKCNTCALRGSEIALFSS